MLKNTQERRLAMVDDLRPMFLKLSASMVDLLIDEGGDEGREALRKILRSIAADTKNWRSLPSEERLTIVCAAHRLGFEIDLRTGSTSS
jgi:hypothetical protein